MFYRPGKDPHNLPHNPFKAIVTPRPIAWVSSKNKHGQVNLAPFSFFNALANDPPVVAIGCNGLKPGTDLRKDTLRNVRETGTFVVNIVSYDLKDKMNVTSQHFLSEVDEFERAGLTKGETFTTDVPRVAEAPASLECRLVQILDLPGENNSAIIGEVVGVHINEAYIVNGILDVSLYKPLSRLGYRDYTAVDTLFSLTRPEET